MYGMLARATVKPGQEGALATLMADWKAAMRPQIPGAFLELAGSIAGDPTQAIFVALAESQSAFEQMAATPEQQAFYARFDTVFIERPTWEMVELDVKSDS